MDFTWKKHEPQASPFAIVAGNPTEYVVYSLSVPRLEIWDQRAGLVRTWLRRALRSPGTQATLASLAQRGVVPAFTAQHHATEFEPL